jgi:hypothetical protein
MKISQLPEEVRIKALEYQKKSKDRRVFDKKTDYLGLAFDWADTKEGHYYWQHWHEREFTEVTGKATTTDTIVLSVIEDLNSRSILGVNKYKTTLDREDLSRKDWLQHAYEECLDQANYLKKLISLEK